MSLIYEETKDGKILKLKDTVVQRSVPMTQGGCDALRSIRKSFQSTIEKESGHKVIMPLPTVIDLVLLDYIKLTGIEVNTHENSLIQ